MEKQEKTFEQKLKEITEAIMSDKVTLPEATEQVKRAHVLFFGTLPVKEKTRRGVGSY
jgi:hypothetical protein